MSKENIILDLTKALEDAAPSNLPASTRGIPGGQIDWEKFATAIVGAFDDLMAENQYVEVESEDVTEQELKRVDE